MPALPGELRRNVETIVLNAREAAEHAAESALAALAVELEKLPPKFPEAQRRLRVALRERGRLLGQGTFAEGRPRLIEEIAYEQWHQMLFARFLAENHLLMHPTGAPVTLEECAELASEEGEPDAWQLAARYASEMLPGIFGKEDAAAKVRFAPESRNELERLLGELPPALFAADDGLGWVYQFWQSHRKDEVNQSGRKIGGADLSPVTQLFTDDYMVRFLLENSLGAWWAARHPDSPLIKQWEYLRFKEDGTPAAGTFSGWPDRAAALTLMDPCCGSGHFLVAELGMLRQMRMKEEGLGEAEAADAVLRDNLFGLELDARCTQIAAFALALAAWRTGGYRQLPIPNIACSGIPVKGQLKQWTKLAKDDVNLRAALERLYELFTDAPDLGSLINPADVPLRDRMFTPDYATLEPLLLKALSKERNDEDPAAAVFGAAAEGVVKAAQLLARKYTLVATNVPYLSSAKQSDSLRGFCNQHHPVFCKDLATVFLDRCREFTVMAGCYAVVTPQTWLFLNSFRKMREYMLKEQSWAMVSRLGSRAFEAISGEIVNVALLIFLNCEPQKNMQMAGIDISSVETVLEKRRSLQDGPLFIVGQQLQLQNPDARVSFERIVTGKLLKDYALSLHGQGSFDDPCYVFRFWEMDTLRPGWIFQQTTGTSQGIYSGCTNIFRWEDGQGMLYAYMQAKAQQGYTTGKWKAGIKAWGKAGVAVSGMKRLYINPYAGESFDTNIAVILPLKPEYLLPIWNYCNSSEFQSDVKAIDGNLKVSCSTYLKVPFDLNHWKAISRELGPLPQPHSDDPTQWLFDGNPAGQQEPLQVIVSRLLGYRWPQQKKDRLDKFSDTDGIVCLQPVAGEPPAHERLRALLAAAYGAEWSNAQQDQLLAQAGAAGKDLKEWLRDDFFKQHCALFHSRPFVWHIWDGRKDGFSALVNYHKLNATNLDKLIYTYLGQWIDTQRAERERGVAGADGRLVAAIELQKSLEAIRDGEPPYDIYVRWKPLHEQPMGWNPDLNDGVRLNIRPFVEAGVLRARFTINWNKDRGANPDGSERLNDLHLTLAEKQAARKKAGKG